MVLTNENVMPLTTLLDLGSIDAATAVNEQRFWSNGARCWPLFICRREHLGYNGSKPEPSMARTRGSKEECMYEHATCASCDHEKYSPV